MISVAARTELDLGLWTDSHSIMLPYFRGFYGAAQNQSRRLLAEAPEGSLHRKYLQAVYLLACDHDARGSAELAAELAGEACGDDPGAQALRLYSLCLVGWAYSTIKRTDELSAAVEALDEASDLREEIESGGNLLRGCCLPYQFRAHVHYYMGHPVNAVDDYNEAVRRVNEYIRQLREAGLLSASPSAGREFISEQLTMLARPVSMRAMILFEEGDFGGAVAGLEVAHEIDQQNPYVLALRGLVEYSRGEFGAALDNLDAAFALVKDAPLGDEVSGRPEYLRALLLHKIREDYQSQPEVLERHREAFLKHADEMSPSAEDLFGPPFERYIGTHSPLEALNCLLLCSDLSKPSASIARRVLWELLYGVDGHDDFMAKLCTFKNWTQGTLRIPDE